MPWNLWLHGSNLGELFKSEGLDFWVALTILVLMRSWPAVLVCLCVCVWGWVGGVLESKKQYLRHCHSLLVFIWKKVCFSLYNSVSYGSIQKHNNWKDLSESSNGLPTKNTEAGGSSWCWWTFVWTDTEKLCLVTRRGCLQPFVLFRHICDPCSWQPPWDLGIERTIK